MHTIEKIYEVEFMRYTNSSMDEINNTNIAKNIWITIGDNHFLIRDGENFLVRESELEKYRKFGGGFRSIRLVGSMIL